MNPILLAMWAYWWRAAGGPEPVSNDPILQSANPRSAYKSMTCNGVEVALDPGPKRAATDHCTACGQPGHCAASCPRKLWRFK